MKRFEFRLKRVLGWYRTQAALREQEMQALLAERRLLALEVSALESEYGAAHSVLSRSSGVSGSDLMSLAVFRVRLGNEIKRKHAHLQGCLKRIAERRSALVEANRRVEMLERLEARARKGWETEASAEEQLLAEENYMARRRQMAEQNLEIA